MKELNEIINSLKESIEATKIKVSDELLFDKAVNIFISDRINNYKNKKEEKLNNELPRDEQMITDKQKYLLKKNGINTDGLTKIEASKIISELKK